MSYILKLLFIFLISVQQETEQAIALRKFVYQKDMSEYCRRRVMPSVFLGRQVVDAYSQILHFSRLELPYSCFVSIRTESGSNIILVIQLMSDTSLVQSCRESKNQLLVYEIGETFGGYWGALPDNVMKPEPPKDDFQYTLKTTQPTTTTTTEKSTTQRRTKPSTTREPDDDDVLRSDQQDYFTVEVPIVNVSAKLVPGRLPTNTIYDPEDSFDMMFDVRPGPGMSYQTKVLPLVQFSIENEVSAQRSGEEPGFTPRYQADFNVYTPDARLSFPKLGPSTQTKFRGKYKYNANRLLNFKKNKQLFAEKDALFYRKSPSYTLPPFYSTSYDSMEPPSQKATERMSWDVIDAILKNLSKTKDDVETTKVDKNIANLLLGLAKIGHNYSVPTSAWHTRHPASTTRRVTTKYRTDSITWRQPSASYRTNYLDEVDDTSTVEVYSEEGNKLSNTRKAMNNNDFMSNSHDNTAALLPLALDVDGVILNVTNLKNNESSINSIMNHPAMITTEVNGTSTTATTPKIDHLRPIAGHGLTILSNIRKRLSTLDRLCDIIKVDFLTTRLKPLTLLDHESWENMVHAASLMAVMLNQTVTQPDGGKQELNVTQAKPSNMRRKKRYIHAIPIEHAKPHHLPLNIEVPSSTVHVDKISDAQDFQRLIELQDDEIHDRVALRYLRQYVGPALFNICDFDEAAARHVYLFNSSRLVLAITNFTLDRMTVVMTPARTLLTSDARCASAHLECQVSGARVCIDSLSACDGVPNCGSYDIYDEDRLTCGGSAGLQHNVCLAAITFLAVLLTILYTVHYWLKRCVPKVSDAFFIYTDAAENVLYLDTIMRSPYDTDDGKYYYRDGTIHDYMECTDMRINTNTISSFVTRLRRFFGCNYKKKETRVSHEEIIQEEFDNMHPEAHRIYSFGEVELGKMASAFVSDAAVQTGSSLEIKVVDNIKIGERKTSSESDNEDDDIVARYEGKRRSTDSRSILEIEMSSNQPSDELSILKFFRRARSVSMQMQSPDEELVYKVDLPAKRMPNSEEKEIQCLEYEHDDNLASFATLDSILKISGEISDKKTEHGLVRKKLRFEEETKTMQADNENDSIEEDIVPERRRRSIVYGGGKNLRLDDTDSNTDADGPSTSTNREFKSYFWGNKNKPKKSTKKKTQLSLLK